MFVKVSTIAAVLAFVNALPVNGVHSAAAPCSLEALYSATTQSKFASSVPVAPTAIVSDTLANFHHDKHVISTAGTNVVHAATPSRDTTGPYFRSIGTSDYASSLRPAFSARQRSIKEHSNPVSNNDSETMAEGEDVGVYTGMTAEQLMSLVRTQPNYRDFATRLNLGTLGALIFYPIPGQREVPDAAIKRAIQRAEPMKARGLDYYHDEGIFFRVNISGVIWRVTWEPDFGKRSPIGYNSEEVWIE